MIKTPIKCPLCGSWVCSDKEVAQVLIEGYNETIIRVFLEKQRKKYEEWEDSWGKENTWTECIDEMLNEVKEAIK